MNMNHWIICVRCPRCMAQHRIYHMFWSASTCQSCHNVLENPMYDEDSGLPIGEAWPECDDHEV